MKTENSILVTNLRRVRERIAAAADRSRRSCKSVQLVAVTKYVDANIARELVNVGCQTLGESRPQELWDKAEALNDLEVRWHLVGHLQRNKVKRTLPFVSLIHSVDSLRLVETIERHAAEEDRNVDILLEVNVSGEADKLGVDPSEVEPILTWFDSTRRTRLKGLMCMAGLSANADQTRHQFASLRKLRDRLLTSAPPSITLDELSMGMSGDFEAAIQEGATIVRIGSVLFKGM